MYAIKNRSAMIKSFDDFQCDFSFDFAWQDRSSFVLCNKSVCSSPHTGIR